jgi:hypothetical protein
MPSMHLCVWWTSHLVPAVLGALQSMKLNSVAHSQAALGSHCRAILRVQLYKVQQLRATARSQRPKTVMKYTKNSYLVQ